MHRTKKSLKRRIFYWTHVELRLFILAIFRACLLFSVSEYRLFLKWFSACERNIQCNAHALLNVKLGETTGFRWCKVFFWGSTCPIDLDYRRLTRSISALASLHFAKFLRYQISVNWLNEKLDISDKVAIICMLLSIQEIVWLTHTHSDNFENQAIDNMYMRSFEKLIAIFTQ